MNINQINFALKALIKNNRISSSEIDDFVSEQEELDDCQEIDHKSISKLCNISDRIIDDCNKELQSLAVPIVRSNKIDQNGFLISINKLEELDRSLIIEGSLCVYYVFRHDYNESEPDYFKQLDGHPLFTVVYIRQGYTNTWFKMHLTTPINQFVDYFENYCEEEYEEEEEQKVIVDFEKLNKLAMIVANSKGFGHLKNQSQRREFAKNALKNIGESDNQYIDYIQSKAHDYYEFCVLPLEVKRLKNEGKSIQEIAKILCHTKTKVDRLEFWDIQDDILQVHNAYLKENK